ncbi:MULTISPECIES: type VI secretion system lipoprotein TssJ [unclassified Pseudomonas]|uniref:type VI secretion system lipoprotein TssJ n=1 Tax=unclassified Pseudomonas TaxID=196821 RepID=UPI0030DB43A3
MNKVFITLYAFCALLVGCSSSQQLTPEQKALGDLKWSYAQNAIELSLTADKDLNQYDGQAHNLLVVITQFDQINAFAAYTGSSQQFSSLLLMNSAPTGMIGLTRIFLEPGQTKTLSLARLEGAKMVGIAVGYAHLDPARSAKLYQIGVDVTSTGFFSKVWTATPQPIAIDLLMGADTLLRGKTSRLALPKPVQPKEGEVRLPGVQQ